MNLWINLSISFVNFKPFTTAGEFRHHIIMNFTYLGDSKIVNLGLAGGKEKIIRFGQQGVSTAGKKTDPKSKARRASFKARHAKNIKKGKMSAAYWADKVKW